MRRARDETCDWVETPYCSACHHTRRRNTNLKIDKPISSGGSITVGFGKGYDRDAVEDAERCIRENEEVDEEALAAFCEKEPPERRK
jgi:hypothetical protein